jgi:hypothetical protein
MAFSWIVTTDLLCNDVPTLTGMEDICFPGGACLSHVLTTLGRIPSPLEVPMQYMSQLGPATAFLQPFMNVIDAVLAVFKCFEGVIDFATSFNPTTLIECIPNLIEKINALLSMIPQLSVPRMVIAIIRALIGILNGIAYELEYIIYRMYVISAEIDRAADLNDVNKSGYLVCAQTTMNESLSAMALSLKAIGRIILIVNIFMGLFGGPEIPCFGEILDGAGVDELQDIIEVIRGLARLLQQILDLIPDPIAALTRALGEKRC